MGPMPRSCSETPATDNCTLTTPVSTHQGPRLALSVLGDTRCQSASAPSCSSAGSVSTMDTVLSVDRTISAVVSATASSANSYRKKHDHGLRCKNVPCSTPGGGIWPSSRMCAIKARKCRCSVARVMVKSLTNAIDSAQRQKAVYTMAKCCSCSAATVNLPVYWEGFKDVPLVLVIR